jgi:hypothetical protein
MGLICGMSRLFGQNDYNITASRASVTVIGDAEREGWKEMRTELAGTVFHAEVAGKFL